LNPAASFARYEWGTLGTAVRTALATRGWRAVPLTLASVCLIALGQLLQDRSWGFDLVRGVGFVRAEDPLWLALLRTPLSLFVPALSLPVWGSMAQVLVVFGIAEITLGRTRTLVVAYACTLAGTLYARFGVAIGPEGHLGLPASDAQVVDTGPSAAVAGLAVCVCVRTGAWCTGALVVAAMMVEVVVKPNLAGKEHLVAIGTALALCASASLRRSRRVPGGGGSGGGAGKNGS
jgi:hypothetical protein